MERVKDSMQATLLATLRRHSPSKVRAYTSDDDFRDIAVPTRRRKWAQVIEAIEARAWSRVELLDKSGAVLGYVDNGAPASEIEDLPEGAQSRKRSEVEWIVGVVVKAQKDALASRDAETVTLLRAQGEVVRELTTAMRSLSEIYRAQADASADLATTQAMAAHGGDSQLKELLDAAPQIISVLPALKGLLGGSAPNGVKPKT